MFILCLSLTESARLTLAECTLALQKHYESDHLGKMLDFVDKNGGCRLQEGEGPLC